MLLLVVRNKAHSGILRTLLRLRLMPTSCKTTFFTQGLLRCKLEAKIRSKFDWWLRVIFRFALYRSLFYAGAWAARVKDQNQWIQADLQATHILESVTTQGRRSSAQRVTSYYVSISQDGTQWVDMRRLYDGNEDANTKQTNSFPANTLARYIRLRPHRWTNGMSLRFEVTGCKAPSKISLITFFVDVYYVIQ